MISVHTKTTHGRISTKGVRLPEPNAVGEIVMPPLELLKLIEQLTDLATERFKPAPAPAPQIIVVKPLAYYRKRG